MDAMTIYGLPGALIVIPFVVFAALWDLAYRRIPNSLTAILLGAWVAATLWTWSQQGPAAFPPDGWTTGVGYAFCVLVAGFYLFCIRAVGAGDVKLAAVLCLWLGKGSASFLLATSLAGGVLVLQLPLLRRLEMAIAIYAMRLPSLAVKDNHPTPMALRRGDSGGLPYGPAIAAGTLFTLLRTWA